MASLGPDDSLSSYRQQVYVIGNRATAVEVESPHGNRERIEAERGVILCGGAIATPQLLLPVVLVLA